jgi:hypothetical protein
MPAPTQVQIDAAREYKARRLTSFLLETCRTSAGSTPQLASHELAGAALAVARTWTTSEWNRIARHAGINPPSPLTVSLVLQRLEACAAPPRAPQPAGAAAFDNLT